MEKRSIRPTALGTHFRRNRRRAQKGKQGDLAALAHKIVNQLTVMNLTCFKLRALVKHKSAADPGDIARLEDAVEKMHGLVESLVALAQRRDVLSEPETKRSLRPPGQNQATCIVSPKLRVVSAE